MDEDKTTSTMQLVNVIAADTTAKEIVKSVKLLLDSDGSETGELKKYLRSLVAQYESVRHPDFSKEMPEFDKVFRDNFYDILG